MPKKSIAAPEPAGAEGTDVAALVPGDGSDGGPRVTTASLADLVPDPANARRHPERNVRATDASLRRFGAARSIVVDGRNVVRAGNRTLESARAAGITEAVIVEARPDQLVVVRRPDWSPSEATAYAIADNRSAELAGWDDRALVEQLAALEEEGFASVDVGFTAEELAALVGEGPDGVDGDADGDGDGTEDGPPEATRTRPGDLWALGPHRLLCGDSTDPASVARVLGGREPALQVVDPPFDLDYDAWSVHPAARVLYVWARGDKALIWMASLGLGEAWGVHTLCFTGAARGWARPEQPCLVHEVVYVLRRKGHEAILDKAVVAGIAAAHGTRATEDGRHFSFNEGLLYRDNHMSWAKPVPCMEFGLIYTPPDSLVYDPCAGAGGMMLACGRHGREFAGIEKNPAWCDYAIARWETETNSEAKIVASS